jgi:hypothetical protein
MANLETHYRDQGRPSLKAGRAGKWSGRSTIGFALLASAILWTLIFYAAKAFVG